MRRTRRITALLLTMFFCFLCVSGCKKETEVITCPFTDVTWGNTLEEIISSSGEPIETRDSIYNGKSYLFSKEYKGHEGTVYYIFDETEKLVSMAWGYSTDSSEELSTLYDELCAEITAEYGESDYTPQLGDGNVWYMDEGNIVLFNIDTAEYKALQLNYVHPDVAEKE